MRESEFAVLNFDDKIVKSFGEKTRCKVVYFSAQTEVNGAYVAAGKVYYKGKFIGEISDLPISGEHNVTTFSRRSALRKSWGLTKR